LREEEQAAMSAGRRSTDADKRTLTRSGFGDAVREALRHFDQTDLLAGNALLYADLLSRAGSDGASPQALKALLAQTAATLFESERDHKLYRVLELTYFNPTLKQAAIAEQLGLSFSTYRRHLAICVDRLTEWLWQQEQQLRDLAAGGATVRPAGDSPVLPVRPRLSIVILPFLNLSQDPQVEYLVDGIVDALITDLANIPGSFVISRSTAFTYKNRAVPIRQVGSELSIRYVAEGSVFVDQERIRVNVQLIDAETDEHLWAERFEKQRRDVWQVQDEIVGRLSRSIGIQLVRSEGFRGSPNTGDVLDLVMRARALVSEVKRKETAAEATDLFQQALKLDPNCVHARIGIALTRIYQVINLYRLDGRDELLDEAEQQLSGAAAHGPDHIDLLKARGLLLRARGRFSEAIVATEALIARNAAEPSAYKEMGLNNLYLGRTREAVEWFRRADAIAPRDPERWTWLQGLGRALMQLGQDAEAVSAMSQAMENNPEYVRGKAMLAAAAALAGDRDTATRCFADYRMHEPTMTIQQFARQRSSVPPDAVSQIYREESRRILEGMRLAGMPDEEIIFEHEMSSF
jgi:adenylate cyclase